METHPYGTFDAPNSKYLLIGSFPGLPSTQITNWFYGSKRTQFWKILQEVYGCELTTIDQRKTLFTGLGLSVTDIIYQAERKEGNNLDSNLVNIVYNIEPIKKIINKRNIKAIYFSSRFVETKFRKMFKSLLLNFPNIKLITLPSPSPRYARLNLAEKIKVYKKLMPVLELLS